MDFKNTIIILTSNLGSQYLLDGISPDGEITPEAREQVEALLRKSFRPEFLNRPGRDRVLQASHQGEHHSIIDLQIADLNRRLADKQLKCHVSDEAKSFIIEAAYDPQYGARPLKRYPPAHRGDAACPPDLEGRRSAWTDPGSHRGKRRVGCRIISLLIPSEIVSQTILLGIIFANKSGKPF